VARFVNAYPNMEVDYRLDEDQTLTSGEPIAMEVTLTRDIEEDDKAADDQIADAPLFPGKKLVNWWLVVGDHSSRALYGIKKVTVKQSLKTKLQFTLPEGSHQLKLYLICDSYTGKPVGS
jgi:pre-mRNA-splicing helicase BRR2